MSSTTKSDKLTRQSGSVLVEYTITFPVFFMILFIGIELARVTFASANLQNAVNRAGRYATLGYHNEKDEHGIDSVSQKITSISGYTLESFRICKADNTDCKINTRGSQGDWMQIRAETIIPVLFGTKKVRLNAGALVKNEPRFALVTEPAPSKNVTNNPDIGIEIKPY